MDPKNVVKLREIREREGDHRLKFQHRMHVTNRFIQRLGLESELEGHTGCVNCLEWNSKGDLLASGSDDLHIILWDPFVHKKLQTIQSGHHGNIFSVKFLPNSGDSVLVSGAADCKIRVHDTNAAETTMACSCHVGRIKRLAVAPNVPFMFWSAAEDGIIMQYDLRVPHQCSNVCNNVLINLTYHIGRIAEAKCIAINPLKPEMLAVGANDPYVRLYDRRMISPSTIKYPAEQSTSSPWERHSYVSACAEVKDDNLPLGCVTYFVAGHLPLKQTDYKKKYRTLTSTYLAFSPDGSELLANLGGEQIYLFNVMKTSKHKLFEYKGLNISTDGFCKDECPLTNGLVQHTSPSSVMLNNIPAPQDPTGTRRKKWLCSRVHSPVVDSIKKVANEYFEQQLYTMAISKYNESISLSPGCACLYGNRAAAFMKRGWDGDVYAALRDCHTALKLDTDYFKAHFRLARCMYELHWTKEASECLQLFKEKFPDHAQSSACESLEKDIKAAVFAEEAESDDPNGTQTSKSRNSAGSNSSSPRHRKTFISENEKIWRSLAYDYESRYCGHCNTTTDIKEANFFGSDGQYIVAGSDDGSFFMWDRVTTNIQRVLRGDDSIVNCLQPHPTSCLLATSGIDPVIRLWSPRPEDGSKEDREVSDSEDAAVANQKRMNADPLEVMLLNMGYRIPGVLDPDDIDSEGNETNIVQCRPS